MLPDVLALPAAAASGTLTCRGEEREQGRASAKCLCVSVCARVCLCVGVSVWGCGCCDAMRLQGPGSAAAARPYGRRGRVTPRRPHRDARWSIYWNPWSVNSQKTGCKIRCAKLHARSRLLGMGSRRRSGDAGGDPKRPSSTVRTCSLKRGGGGACQCTCLDCCALRGKLPRLKQCGEVQVQGVAPGCKATAALGARGSSCGAPMQACAQVLDTWRDRQTGR